MDYETQLPSSAEKTYAKDIQDPYDQSVLKQILICEETDRPYNIIQSELSFYEKHGLPLPRLHPLIRKQIRLKERNTQFIKII